MAGNSENKTAELKTISDSLKTLANEREKEIVPEKLKIKNAIEKENKKQIRIHARNTIRMRKEVTNYLQITSYIDSMVDYINQEPEQSVIFNSIPTIVESIDSSLATGNLKNILKTMDQIEKQFFDKEAVAKFKSSSESGTELISEDDEINSLIQKVTEEYKMNELSQKSSIDHAITMKDNEVKEG